MLADVANPEGKQESFQGRLLTLVDGLHQLRGTLVTHARECGELFGSQVIQIGETLDEAGLGELIDDLRTEALDVHGLARGKVREPLLELSGTSEPSATRDGLALGPVNLRITHRA